MKYTNQVEINLSKTTVISLFLASENYPKWQKNLKSYEPLNGTPGQKGAQAKLRLDNGKRTIEMVETIHENSLPDKLIVNYMTQDVRNTQINLFLSLSAEKTLYITQSEFSFSGYMKIIGWLFSNSFKKETQQMLEEFKLFAETSVERQSVAGF